MLTSNDFTPGSNLKKKVLTGKPVVVILSKTNCGRCQKLAPTFSKIPGRDRHIVKIDKCSQQERDGFVKHVSKLHKGPKLLPIFLYFDKNGRFERIE